MNKALLLLPLLVACSRTTDPQPKAAPASLAPDEPVMVTRPAPPPSSTPTDPLAVPALAAAARAAFERHGAVDIPALVAPLAPAALNAKAVRFDEGVGMRRTHIEAGYKTAFVSLLTLAPNADYAAAVEGVAASNGLVANRATEPQVPSPTGATVRAFDRGAADHVTFEDRTPPGQPRRVDVRVETRGAAEAAPLAPPPGLPDVLGPMPAGLTLRGWERGQYHAASPAPAHTDVSRWVLGYAAASPAARDEARATLENRVKGDGFEPDAKRPGYFERKATGESVFLRSDDAPTLALVVSVQRRWRR